MARRIVIVMRRYPPCFSVILPRFYALSGCAGKQCDGCGERARREGRRGASEEEGSWLGRRGKKMGEERAECLQLCGWPNA